jgi:hypothetical protein
MIALGILVEMRKLSIHLRLEEHQDRRIDGEWEGHRRERGLSIDNGSRRTYSIHI